MNFQFPDSRRVRFYSRSDVGAMADILRLWYELAQQTADGPEGASHDSASVKRRGNATKAISVVVSIEC